jgi:hypothetical protein
MLGGLVVRSDDRVLICLRIGRKAQRVAASQDPPLTRSGASAPRWELASLALLSVMLAGWVLRLRINP